MLSHKTEKVWKKCFPNLVLNLVTSFESCHESCHESCPVWHLIKYTPLAKLLARCARLGRTRYGSGNHAENYLSISATNQHQIS